LGDILGNLIVEFLSRFVVFCLGVSIRLISLSTIYKVLLARLSTTKCVYIDVAMEVIGGI
jgi:hypothetical protein